MCALLSSEADDLDKTIRNVQECRDLGVQILPCDLNMSEKGFKVEVLPDGQKAIRYALQGIKGVGDTACDELLTERDRNGPFTSLADVLNRTDGRAVHKKIMNILIMAGALDSIEPNRFRLLNEYLFDLRSFRETLAGLIAQVEKLQDKKSRDLAVVTLIVDKISHRVFFPNRVYELFRDVLVDGAEIIVLTKKAKQYDCELQAAKLVENTTKELKRYDETAWDDKARLIMERDLLGFYLTGHPTGDLPISRWQDKKFGETFMVSGLVSGIKVFKDKKQQTMASVDLDTVIGPCKAFIFSRAYKQLASQIHGLDIMVAQVKKLDGRNSMQIVKLVDANKVRAAKQKEFYEVFRAPIRRHPTERFMDGYA